MVNTRGELIGINTAIASRTGSYSGYSFAIPSSIVRKVISDLMEFGVVQRAVLGVQINDLSAEKAKELNIEKIEGVIVEQIFDGGSAKSSGIEISDVIIKIGAIKVGKVAELQEQISKYRPGDAIKVTINRKGKIKEIDVILKNKSGNTEIVSNDLVTALGANLEELSA
ncbi:MAG TPA: hypothetical protein DCQ31_16425, partial [Bacteroidales bacterium]|nr:hypothetical protein [Bacteroidales bacterium]